VSDGRRILLCDAESRSLHALRVVLHGAGFEVDATRTAVEALDRGALSLPTAAIIELVLPDGDGVEVCQRLREWSAMPVILLELNGLEIDLAARAVLRDGDQIHLTPIELELLRVLLQNRGRLLTHNALLQQVWGAGYVDARQTLRAHIANLRRKVEPADGVRLIHTDHGVGYRLADLHPEGARRGRPAEEVIDRELVRSRVSALHDPRPGASARPRAAVSWIVLTAAWHDSVGELGSPGPGRRRSHWVRATNPFRQLAVRRDYEVFRLRPTRCVIRSGPVAATVDAHLSEGAT
jgi:two-component system KDP operon response regulator KdpE